MTNGWTDRRRRTILNFLVNSPRGTVFLKSIDASDICKTADKIYKIMDDVVEEIGEDNVIQIVIYIFLNDAPIMNYIFLSTCNSYESSYDPQVMSFHSPSRSFYNVRV